MFVNVIKELSCDRCRASLLIYSFKNIYDHRSYILSHNIVVVVFLFILCFCSSMFPNYFYLTQIQSFSSAAIS